MNILEMIGAATLLLIVIGFALYCVGFIKVSRKPFPKDGDK